ncbi:MAG: class I SAM-dependent RNA methyltransferase [Myxococcales bacterium]|nr:class I SAM-dependent RNA methyltransferase [Myxococcales bacterium]
MSAREIVEGVVEELGHGGDGRVVGPRGALYVPSVLPGERVRVRAGGGKRPLAELLEVLEPSPARRAAPCPIAARCGGCPWMEFDEATAAEEKRAMLARASGVAEPRLFTSERALRYRRRARLHFDAGRGKLGYRARRSHEIVGFERCLVLTDALERAAGLARRVLPELTGKGELALAETLDGASLVFDSDRAEPPSAYRALEALAAEEGVASVALRVPGLPTPSVFGRPTERHLGPDGLPLETPLGGFVQAHADVNEALARTVDEWAAPEGRRVVELFAGSGNLTVLLARTAASILAVEGYVRAAELAEVNLRARGLSARVLGVDAERAKLPRADVLVLDPPRRGFPELERALDRTKPTTVVLVSCDLGSMMRELGTLRRAGFDAKEVAGFDMFPQTPHLEAVVRLEAR